MCVFDTQYLVPYVSVGCFMIPMLCGIEKETMETTSFIIAFCIEREEVGNY